MHGICAFCGKQALLRESHVLPAFIFRWLRNRSGVASHLRHTDSPNRRVQDGLKFPWLCNDCEGHFNRYETAFANQVFYPWHSGKQRIDYGNWLLKFCVTISWRVLKFARGKNKNPSYTDEQMRLMDEAEARWRAFLNDDVPHPGDFEQHVLIFDTIADTNVPGLPNNFNRFMTGAVTLDIVGSRNSLMTFAKLGRFNIFGIIQKGRGEWDGTKIHVRQGLLKPDKIVIPAGLLDLFIEKAAHASKSIANISKLQRKKIDDNVIKNIDIFAKSDQFASILADAEMFGKDAVLWKDEP
jgi:hypothetical protein